MWPLLKGLLIGFSIAAPVGPIGLLCIRRSLTEGRLAGFVSGLGAATADAIYGLVAVLGLTALTTALLELRPWLQVGGGAFLLYLGVATMRARPPAMAGRAAKTRNLAGAYASTFALTLANPVTVLSFLGIFAGLGAGIANSGAWTSGLLVLGVFAGSAAWWLVLSAMAGWLGGRLEHGGLRIVNVGSGVIIAAFGLWQIADLVRSGR